MEPSNSAGSSSGSGDDGAGDASSIGVASLDDATTGAALETFGSAAGAGSCGLASIGFQGVLSTARVPSARPGISGAASVWASVSSSATIVCTGTKPLVSTGGAATDGVTGVSSAALDVSSALTETSAVAGEVDSVSMTTSSSGTKSEVSFLLVISSLFTSTTGETSALRTASVDVVDVVASDVVVVAVLASVVVVVLASVVVVVLASVVVVVLASVVVVVVVVVLSTGCETILILPIGS